MANRPTSNEEDTMAKTTCPGHRIEGYYYDGTAWRCRRCDLTAAQHETIQETLERNSQEAVR